MNEKETINELNKNINKGTGAGGSNTNLHGKEFENLINAETFLIKEDFKKIIIDTKKKYGYYLEKTIGDKIIRYVTQSGLGIYMEWMYKIRIFRHPDEAYIIVETNKKPIIKILEKKEQNMEGSVETKLWAGPSLKREYEIVCGDKFQIEYAYSINTFLDDKLNSDEKKYQILLQILNESNINIFHGNSNNYYKKLKKWIGITDIELLLKEHTLDVKVQTINHNSFLNLSLGNKDIDI